MKVCTAQELLIHSSVTKPLQDMEYSTKSPGNRVKLLPQGLILFALVSMAKCSLPLKREGVSTFPLNLLYFYFKNSNKLNPSLKTTTKHEVIPIRWPDPVLCAAQWAQLSCHPRLIFFSNSETEKSILLTCCMILVKMYMAIQGSRIIYLLPI